jgi:hypothetical protein
MPYDQLATEASLAKAVAALKANGFDAHVVENGDAARKKALEIIPEGAEVMTMSSVTVEAIGLKKELNESGRYRPTRDRLMKLDRKIPEQHREMQRLGAAPEWSVGSVHAVTEDGQLLMASATGSQMPAHVYGADRVVFAVGAQKVVKDVQDGIRRIYEHAFPLEDERAKKAYGFGSSVTDILIMNKVPPSMPGRVSVILIREKLGF